MSKSRHPPAFTRVFNKLAVRVSGSRFAPMWAKVEHRGRTSGRTYRTPVTVIPGDGVFYVTLPWGRGTDWVKNLRAAGGGTVSWKGRRYAVTNPVFVEPAEALPHFNAVQRRMVERFRPADFLRLEHD